jgi:hypothetical protein
MSRWIEYCNLFCASNDPASVGDKSHLGDKSQKLGDKSQQPSTK